MFKVLLVLGGLGGLFAASAERQPSPLIREVKSLDEWVEVFKNREADERRGGIRVHRLLEVDPLPPQTTPRLLNICLKYSEDLSRAPANSPVEGLKRQFWEEIKPMGLSLLHPMCVRMMAECGDVLTAEEVVELVKEHPVLVFSNYDLLTKIKDYSLFTPEHVQTVFESPLVAGLNIATIPDALKTLPAESLVKLLEMMAWDVEDWEMVALVDARGGLQGLINDLNDHLNSWNLLTRFPWILNEMIQAGQFKSMVPRIIEALESGNYVKEQMFMALVNLIVTQEFMLTAPRAPNLDDISVMVLADKAKIKSLLNESADFGPLYDLICTPLADHQYADDNTMYGNELSDTLEEFLDYWREMAGSFLGESNLFITSAYARNLFHLVIKSFPESDADLAISFFYENRLHVIHLDSVIAMRIAWPSSEKVMQVEREFFEPNSTDVSTQRIFSQFKSTCFEVGVYRVIFNDSKEDKERSSEAIGAWVSWQMQLQAAGALLKQLDKTYMAERLLPAILKDEQVGAVVEEYPNIFLSNQVVSWLLENDQDLLRKYPRLLHGLGDYQCFTGAHFQSLSVDFAQVRRGLSTVPTVQLVFYFKSKQGLIDDPISVLGALCPSVWKSLSYVKHLDIGFRTPLMIEEVAYGQYIDAAYIGPKSVESGDPKKLLWSAVKFAINSEIMYQEFLVADKAILTGTKRKIDEWLSTGEAFYRPGVIYKLGSVDLSAAEYSSLKPLYAAVIKTLQTLPLSRDRLDMEKRYLAPVFPSLSVKSFDANFTKSHQNFKMLVGKLAENETVKEFWLFLLAICRGDYAEVEAKLNDLSISAYYRALGKRRISLSKK